VSDSIEAVDPADATHVAEWAHIFSLDELHRFFCGTRAGSHTAMLAVGSLLDPRHLLACVDRIG
jgi:hypothetical protein